MREVGLDRRFLESGNEGGEFGGADFIVSGERRGVSGRADWWHVVPFYTLIEAEGHIVPGMLSIWSRMEWSEGVLPTKGVNQRDMMDEVTEPTFRDNHVS